MLGPIQRATTLPSFPNLVVSSILPPTTTTTLRSILELLPLARPRHASRSAVTLAHPYPNSLINHCPPSPTSLFPHQPFPFHH